MVSPPLIDPPGRPAAAEPRTVVPELLRGWPLPRPGAGDGKEERGPVLVVGGSRQTPGAVILAGTAALRAGAGKLQIATSASTATAVAVSLPEALVEGVPETEGGTIAPGAADRIVDMGSDAAAVLVGSGMRAGEGLDRLIEELVDRVEAPVLVVDANALGHVVRPRAVPGSHLVLTPNAGEMAGLLGVEKQEVLDDLQGAARRVAAHLRAVVAVRHAETWLVEESGPAYCDRSGDVGLGTSGSGDVLAGLVTGLAARGAEPLQAALWAVHLHGRAGERLAGRLGRTGFLARELLDDLPHVMSELGAW